MIAILFCLVTAFDRAQPMSSIPARAVQPRSAASSGTWRVVNAKVAWIDNGIPRGRLSERHVFAVDRGGRVFVPTSRERRITVLDSNGTVLASLVNIGDSTAGGVSPTALGIDARENLWIRDASGARYVVGVPKIRGKSVSLGALKIVNMPDRSVTISAPHFDSARKLPL